MSAPADGFRDAVVRLLDAFDGVAGRHGEVHDTMVREMNFDALYHAFLQDGEGGEVGDSFGMFSPEANAEVRDVLVAFVTDPAVVSTRAALTAPQQRLETFQASGIASGKGSTTDEYFGYVDTLD